MTQAHPRLTSLLADIDALNNQDPQHIDSEYGRLPSEIVYSRRMQSCLRSFKADANEPLTIAAYAQHIQRWTIPRSDYPMDRAGYKRWRTELAKFHANTTGELMQKHHYDDADIERVKHLLQKKKLKLDADTQALEDVICLVFLQYYIEDFATKHSEEKLIGIVQKTWKKMSEDGHRAALALNLPQHLIQLLQKALNI